MRFKVPQFIEIEDKIFGPLTWRQFLYLGGGIGMAVVLFFTLGAVSLIIGIPLALLAGALSFYPINNRPFSYFLEAIFTYMKGQRLYLWRQKSEILHKASTTKDGQSKYSAQKNSPTKPKSDLTSMARKLELQALQKTE